MSLIASYVVRRIVYRFACRGKYRVSLRMLCVAWTTARDICSDKRHKTHQAKRQTTRHMPSDTRYLPRHCVQTRNTTYDKRDIISGFKCRQLLRMSCVISCVASHVVRRIVCRVEMSGVASYVVTHDILHGTNRNQ